MSSSSGISGRPGPGIPSDDLKRVLTLARPDTDQSLRHIGVVGDTYTILLTGKDTNGRFCLIDMLVPPGGGPPPHRHDFEETFIVQEGDLEATFRSKKLLARAGDTIHIPSNAPHQFHNSSSKPVRMLCICSPAGAEKFFLEIGAPLDTRTTPPPRLDHAGQEKLIAKIRELAPKYGVELLESA